MSQYKVYQSNTLSDLYKTFLNNKPQTGYSYNISPWQQQYGYGLNPFIGKYRQQGYGIGNILGSLFKTVVPLIKPVIKNVGKRMLKTAGKRALTGGVRVIDNVIQGKTIKDSLQNEKKLLKNEAEQYMNKQVEKLSSNIKKRKKQTKNKSNKKRKLNLSKDIFA